MAFFWRTKILEVLFWYVLCSKIASIPYDKYGWISEVFNVLRIGSGMIRFSLYKSSIGFATFVDTSVKRLTKFNFGSRCMPKNLVSEASLILLLPILIMLPILSYSNNNNLHFYYKRTAGIWFYLQWC